MFVPASSIPAHAQDLSTFRLENFNLALLARPIFKLGQIVEVNFPGYPAHYGVVAAVGWNGQIAIAHNSKSKRGVVLDSIEQFGDGNAVKVARDPDSPEHTQEIIQKAFSAVRGHVPYFTEAQNCEHFVTWCYTGKAVSPTADKYKAVALSALLIAGLWGFGSGGQK